MSSWFSSSSKSKIHFLGRNIVVVGCLVEEERRWGKRRSCQSKHVQTSWKERRLLSRQPPKT